MPSTEEEDKSSQPPEDYFMLVSILLNQDFKSQFIYVKSLLLKMLWEVSTIV